MLTEEDNKEKITSDSKGIRLHVYISKTGLASRRASEKLISAGRVKVNGIIIAKQGSLVFEQDIVEVDNQLVRPEKLYHYIALNKPPGYVSSMKDEWNRPLAVSLIKTDIKERVYNIGRLDKDSCGLLLFSNDGAFAAHLGHPSSGIIKEYYVQCDNFIPKAFVDGFMQGIEDEGDILKAESVELCNEKSCVIRLIEGKNREIRRVLRKFYLGAVLLKQTSIGPVKLGSLAEGKWRNLSDMEVSKLVGENK